MPTRKPRVFVSFDFDNDKKLYDFIIGQSKLEDSPFDVANWSMKEAAPQAKWETEARGRIQRVDTVIVMLGPLTSRAPGVLKEVRFAGEFGTKIFQIIGYRNSKPTPVPNAGLVYPWNWADLKKLLPSVQY